MNQLPFPMLKTVLFQLFISETDTSLPLELNGKQLESPVRIEPEQILVLVLMFNNFVSFF